MATTPNFLRLESILTSAIAFLERRSDSAEAARWGKELESALTLFRESRKLTDTAYLTWRETFYEVIRVHKALRLAYDAVRTECEEWGITDYPNFYITYTDEERTQRVATETLAFLNKLDLDEAWVAEAKNLLQTRLAEAKASIVHQEAKLGDYRRHASARKVGYGGALDVAKQFFASVKGKLAYGSDDYNALTTDAW